MSKPRHKCSLLDIRKSTTDRNFRISSPPRSPKQRWLARHASCLAFWPLRCSRMMPEDFLTARTKLVAATAMVVPPFVWHGAKSGKCYHNVQRLTAQHGGSYSYDWTLSEVGPTVLSSPARPPLYSRWVNHVVWRDRQGQTWEATPSWNPLEGTTACNPRG